MLWVGWILSRGPTSARAPACTYVTVKAMLSPESGEALHHLMILPNPLCPISSAGIAGLKTTVMLLMLLLLKSKMMRIKMSLLGSLIGFTLLIGFLISTGVLTIVTGGALTYAAMQSKPKN